MKVLKATLQQKEEIEKFLNPTPHGKWGGNIFVQDADGNWITGKSILKNKAYSSVLSQLEQLEEIIYNPLIEEL